MRKVLPENAAPLEDPASSQLAPKKILKSTYDSVITALENHKKVILISGEARKGKTALIHTISKDIAKKYRIIAISSKDLPQLDKIKDNVSAAELNNVKDFIIESTDLEDKLLVTLDDAHCLPVSFTSELLEHALHSESNAHSLQLIISGPLNFKDQLLALEQVNPSDITYCPMDSLSEQEIHTYAKNKDYKISSNIKRLEFKVESLRALADFVQTDQQLLDVILEWCAALAKKDQLTSITPHVVNRASGFAQQFSKDKQVRLVNSYPPSHEVYKYINDIQSAKKTTTESVKKADIRKASKPFIQSNKEPGTQKSKIPVDTSKVAQNQDTEISNTELLQNLREIEEDIMPTQWTPPPKTAHKKPFPAIPGLISLLLLGFIAFIAFRIGSNPEVKEFPQQEVASNQFEEMIDKPQAEPNATETIVTTTENTAAANSIIQEVDNSENAENSSQPSTESSTAAHTGIIASDTKGAVDAKSQSPIPVDYNTSNANEAATDLNKNILEDNQTKKKQQSLTKLAQNQAKSQQELKAQGETQKESKKEEETDLLVNDNTSASAEINNLLILADYQFENKQLSTPPGDNALETYQKLLAKYPDNKAAADGVKKVHDKYLNWANYYLQQNDMKRAKRFYSKAIKIDPNDSVAIAGLQNIARHEANAAEKATQATNTLNSAPAQANKPLSAIDALLVSAEQNMQQIASDINANNRNYKYYQEAQAEYQHILNLAPQNQQALQGLATLKKYYVDWAELQIQSRNYNIALFLYGQALSIEPSNTQLSQRIEQIRELKSTL